MPDTLLPEERMRALHTTHAPSLLKYLLRLTTGERELAEDLLQETMLRAWRSLDDVPADHESQRRWLFTVARRNAIDAARARQVRPREVAADDMTQIPAEDKAIDEVVAAHTVRRVLHRLTDDHLTVVIGLYYRGLSTTEMARQLGVPEGTVKSRTHYALRTLRGAIGRIDRV